ncbi:MAG: hypothetical protein ICV72_05420, partial [Aldersonia sp.]|nr:hypothetical protein [Aldersonia sp.]
LAAPVTAIAQSGPVPDPRLTALRCTLRPDGGVDRILHVGTVPVDDAPVLLGVTLERIVTTLAAVSDAGLVALRAVTSDAIATRALAAAGPSEADALATRLAAAMDVLPRPRFVDVGGRRFVHRNSCCLMCDLSRPQMCISCPKRIPEERRELLARVAAGR